MLGLCQNSLRVYDLRMYLFIQAGLLQEDRDPCPPQYCSPQPQPQCKLRPTPWRDLKLFPHIKHVAVPNMILDHLHCSKLIAFQFALFLDSSKAVCGFITLVRSSD